MERSESSRARKGEYTCNLISCLRWMQLKYVPIEFIILKIFSSVVIPHAILILLNIFNVFSYIFYPLNRTNSMGHF